MRIMRGAAVPAILLSVFAGQVVLADTASAATVTKAELKGGQLRVEGIAAPILFTIASSTTSAAGARSGLDGKFVIEASNFTAPDCKVTVSDSGSTPIATATLSGCTPSITPVAAPAPPTGTCVITPAAPAALALNQPTAYFFFTSGCNTTFNTGGIPKPVEWTVVAGSIPTGMTGPTWQGTEAGNVSGTPSVAGTYTFTLQVTDSAGQIDQENVTLTVA